MPDDRPHSPAPPVETTSSPADADAADTADTMDDGREERVPPLPPGVDPARWRRNVKAAAARALTEAAARREARDSSPARAGERPREIGGPQGPEPTRYGDWERKGIVSDF